ncbi:MAG TPA: PA14 domain-containing protein [Candidatus Limnocylindrales bacterium]|nr:PA14 domain-containing protein [Candidatus Limnocylindrales bacterium]
MKTMRFLIPVLALLLALSLVAPAAEAQSGNVWSLEFFNNTALVGPAVFTGQTSFINFNWGLGSPAPQVPVDFFSGRFATATFFNPGMYTFSIVADDGFTLRVDNAIFLNTFSAPQPGKAFTIDIPLTQGVHVIQVDYVELTGLAFVSVNWFFSKPISGIPQPPAIVPTAPPSGQSPFSSASVTTRFGNYTPCIQQQSHQANCFVSDGNWNSPNRGSIQLEPQIVLWRNCTANVVITQQLFPGQPAVQTTCSKTEAGFFPTVPR